jgi:putative hydroxymethylpyrimidine transport system substrate-binding protein
MDAGRYATFETFLHDAGLTPTISPVSTIAIDVTFP